MSAHSPLDQVRMIKVRVPLDDAELLSPTESPSCSADGAKHGLCRPVAAADGVTCAISWEDMPLSALGLLPAK